MYFADYQIEEIVSEPQPPLYKDLFGNKTADKIHQQYKIFDKLSEGLPVYNGFSFRNQVNFQFAHKTPVQRWFPYREGYSINLVNTFLNELGISGTVFDPFCGSGTTLLSARHNELPAYGMDTNPISVLVSEVENANYTSSDIDELANQISKLEEQCKNYRSYVVDYSLLNKVFNDGILHSLLQLKEVIKEIDNYKLSNIFWLGWLAVIEEVSNIKKEGNGIKYKNRKRTPNGYINLDKETWENQVFPEDKFEFVKQKLISRLNIIFHDLTKQYGPVNTVPVTYEGDCLTFDEYFNEPLAFTFFSPPYCNCFDYFEIHKLELWMGDFVRSREELQQLKNTGFRSNTNALNHKQVNHKHPELENLIDLLDEERLWSKKIPNVIRGYFDDTYKLLTKLFRQTKKGGYVGIVVGNSAYTGVIIPTDLLYADLAKQAGFTVENIFITRHLTTSSQQKQELESLKQYLRESIVLIKKP